MALFRRRLRLISAHVNNRGTITEQLLYSASPALLTVQGLQSASLGKAERTELWDVEILGGDVRFKLII